MAIHLSRDYLTQNTTTGNRVFIPTYLSSIFLRRVLGYSYVGDTAFNINNVGQWLFATGDSTPSVAPTFAANTKAGIANNASNIEVSIPIGVRGVVSSDIGRILCLKSPLYPTRNSGLFVISALQQGNTTTIAAGSNNVALPTGTINVASTTGFPSSGTLFIGPNTSQTAPLSTTIAAGSNNVSLPTGTINVASTTGFPASGQILISDTAGTQVVTYGSLNGTQFLSCTGGTGTLLTGQLVQSATTINVSATTTVGFTGTGSLHILTTAGVQTVAYTGTTATTFTGCTGLSGLLFTGGTVFSSNDIQTITYTNISAAPAQFLGCTGGTGTLVTGEPVYNQNKFVIDYRGNGDLSLVEATDTVPWYLYDKDINCPTNGANNTSSASQYRGSGNSTTPRIILQSPHVLGWQVRLCNETTTDTFTNFNVDQITWAPGYGGNAAGDFQTGGKHLHGAMFYDTSVAGYNTCTGMGDNAGAGPQYRMTFVGDDTGQYFISMARRPLDATTPESCLITFGGFPDNEPSPIPLDNTERLFALGNGAANNVGNGRMNQGSLSVGSYVNSNRIQGASFHYVPISCSPSLWTYLTGVTQQSSPMYDAQAADSVFTSATELTSVDLVVGVVHTWNDVDNTVRLPYYPRIIGTLPQIKSGRTNFGNYTLTTDTGSWTVSTTSGNAVSPIQITTTTTNNLVTGQTVAINGVTGNTAANGTFVVTVINNTNFTLNGTTGNGTFGGGGTVLRGASFQHLRFGTYIPWNGPAVVP